MSLFQLGDFTLASGKRSHWKIECDALTYVDWLALAAMAAEMLPPFGVVLGVPSGGMPFARALKPYATTGPPLIADDVWTTGGSWRRFREQASVRHDALGVVAFARGPVDDPTVLALFTLNHGKDTP